MILVVGGTGFIGKTLVEALQAAGRRALCVSRNPDTDFLERHAPGCTAMTLDALRDDPGRALQGIEGCVYLASAGRLGDHGDTPWLEARRMVGPLMRLLHLLGEHAPVPVVYLSSAAVYGRRDKALFLRETMAPRPITPYGTGKAMAELAVAAAGRQSGMPTRILRPSTPIGRWQAGKARGAVGALMEAAAGGSFTLNGDGSAVRDFFDARDLARAIIAALDFPRRGHRVWNVGSGTGTSLAELIAAAEAATGRAIPVTRRPMPEGEVPRAVLDISRIEADLGWKPDIPLHRALEQCWQAWKDGPASGPAA